MGTITEAHKFFRDHVAPSIQDWQTNGTEIYKAMSVATNLAHMADYYWKSFSNDDGRVFGATSLTSLKGILERKYPHYSLIRDVCDAHKHLKLDRASKCVTNANQTAIGNMGWDEASWDEAQWDSSEEIVVTDDRGEKHHFVELVRRTEEMWKSLLV